MQTSDVMTARGLRTIALIVAATALSGCDRSADNGTLAEAEQRADAQRLEAGMIPCALSGAKQFTTNCTIEERSGPDGLILTVGRRDVGYRQLLVTTDGRGVVAADGAEPATVTVIEDGVIEVGIATDRYRLPATTR